MAGNTENIRLCLLAAVVLLNACAPKMPSALSTTDTTSKSHKSIAPYKSNIAEKLHAFYWMNRDRFQLKCLSKVKRPIVIDLDRSYSAKSKPVGLEKVQIRAIYPDATTALRQLIPHPYYFLEVLSKNKDGSEVNRRIKSNKNGSVELKIDGSPYYCLLDSIPSSPFRLFSEHKKLIQLLVHPHDLFDPSRKLIGKLEPYLLDETIKSLIFFESHGMPYHLVKAANRETQRTDEYWDAERDVFLTALGQASLHIAYRGIFRF